MSKVRIQKTADKLERGQKVHKVLLRRRRKQEKKAEIDDVSSIFPSLVLGNSAQAGNDESITLIQGQLGSYFYISCNRSTKNNAYCSTLITNLQTEPFIKQIVYSNLLVTVL
jgi:hypothetical protein